MERKRKKQSLILWVILTVLALTGLSYLVRRFTKDNHVANQHPQRLSSPPNSISASPVIVKFGFYPLGIYDLNPSEGSFMADFYVWLKYDKSTDPAAKEYRNTADSEKGVPRIERLEANNGDALTIDRQEYSSPDEYRVWFRVRGKFYHNFDVHRYPFDEQQLEIRLENPIYPTSQLRYTVDAASSYSSL